MRGFFGLQQTAIQVIVAVTLDSRLVTIHGLTVNSNIVGSIAHKV